MVCWSSKVDHLTQTKSKIKIKQPINSIIHSDWFICIPG